MPASAHRVHSELLLDQVGPLEVRVVLQYQAVQPCIVTLQVKDLWHKIGQPHQLGDVGVRSSYQAQQLLVGGLAGPVPVGSRHCYAVGSRLCDAAHRAAHHRAGHPPPYPLLVQVGQLSRATTRGGRLSYNLQKGARLWCRRCARVCSAV